jgi:hypothetical protein
MKTISSFVSSYNYLDEYYLVSKHFSDADIYAFLSLSYIKPPVPRTMVNDFSSILKTTCTNFHLSQRSLNSLCYILRIELSDLDKLHIHAIMFNDIKLTKILPLHFCNAFYKRWVNATRSRTSIIKPNGDENNGYLRYCFKISNHERYIIENTANKNNLPILILSDGLNRKIKL